MDNIFEDSKPEAKGVTATPAEPLPRIKACMVLYKDKLYIYGGLVEVGDREVTMDDMWALDLKSKKWECLFVGTVNHQVWKGETEETDSVSYQSTGDDDDEDDDSDDEDKIIVLDDNTPGPKEAQADFYTRKSELWNGLVEADEDTPRKEITRQGFALAKRRYEDVQQTRTIPEDEEE